MSIALVAHKISYLQEKISPFVHREWELHFETQAAPLLSAHHHPQFLATYLCLDLSYLCARHHLWLEHRLFFQAVRSYLQETYKIPGPLAQELLQPFAAKAKEFLPETTHPFFAADNQNFLLYIFVHALTARSHRQLVADLGLGTQLLLRLQQAASYLAEYQKNREKVYFQTNHDSEMIAVITELSEKRASIPWIADHYRLLFQTADIQAPWDSSSLVDRDGTRLFSFLQHLGEKKTLSLTDCISWFEDQGQHPLEGGGPALASQESYQRFFHELVVRHLLDESAVPLHDSGPGLVKLKAPPPPFYQLGALGYEYTAEAFARQHDDQLLPLSELVHLSPAWQTAYFHHLSPQHRNHIQSLLSQSPRLHPTAMEEAVRKISCNANLNEVFLDLVKISQSGIPAIRAAACRSLVHLRSLPQTSEMLGKIAVNDGSAWVRETALEELRRILPQNALSIYHQAPLATGKIA